MNKQQTNYHRQAGNILPVVVIVGLILGAGYLLMGEDFKLPKLAGEPKLERIEGFPRKIYITDGSERDKKREVITSEEELTQFLNEVDDTGQIQFNSAVNFNREYLLAVSTNLLDEDGHGFKIKKILKDTKDKSLTVVLERKDPDDSCEVEMDPNIWVDFAKIDKTDWKIEFEIVKKVEPCD